MATNSTAVTVCADRVTLARRWLKPLQTLAAALVMLLAAVGAMTAPAWAVDETTTLIMFDSPACGWCVRWHRQVGPSYPSSPEGKAAPLRTVQISDGRPRDIEFLSPVTVTPTFVLVDKGREVGRIIGHPGVEPFYERLRDLLDRLPSDWRQPGTPPTLVRPDGLVRTGGVGPAQPTLLWPLAWPGSANRFR